MKKNAYEYFDRLSKMYPNPKCALNFSSAWELLVATILSAQCTDKRVNLITPQLFKELPTMQDYIDVEQGHLEQLIRSSGFFRNKAKNIKAAAKTLVEQFNSTVPDEMDDLLKIPGIARKSANVLLFVWFGKNEGVVVDTHVKRLSNRLGLTKEQNPVKIERDLMKLFKQKDWGMFSYYLVDHGRALCKAPTPKCALCKLNDICPSAKKYL
ncbi:endonuclease III [Patescibacteria group bacterium]